MPEELRCSSLGASERFRDSCPGRYLGGSRFAALVLGTTVLVAVGSRAAYAQDASPPPRRPEEPPEKAQCLSAHEEAQTARIARHFGEARTKLRACAREECPGLVRDDCVNWLGELAKISPSVIVDADVDGQQAPSTRVYLDGTLLVDHLDGQAVELDPGVHKFRFEVQGFSPQEQDVVVSEGVQGRVIAANFHHDLREPPLAPRAALATRPVPASALISSVVALTGVASTAVFGALAISEKSSLSQSCAPFCSDSQVGAVRGYAVAADISAGVAAAAAAFAGYFFLTRPEQSRRSSVSFTPAPLPQHGGLLAARLSF
jgi:hypothetical protein